MDNACTWWCWSCDISMFNVESFEISTTSTNNKKQMIRFIFLEEDIDTISLFDLLIRFPVDIEDLLPFHHNV